MGVGKINIWVSDVDNACGIWDGSGIITVFDCKGILTWPCGRYQEPNGNWVPVPNGEYKNLPFRCGRLEVEVPPGTYWVTAGSVTANDNFIHLNYATHVGIARVDCSEPTCVTLFNPSVRLCWNWFLIGARMIALSGKTKITTDKVEELARLGEDLLKDAPHLQIEKNLIAHFENNIEIAKRKKVQK